MRSKLLLVMLLMATVCGGLLVGCSSETAYAEETVPPAKKESNVAYGDIVHDQLNFLGKDMTNRLVPEKNGDVYSDIVRTCDAAKSIFPNIWISESAASVYDESYFSSYDLLVLAFPANSVFKYIVEAISIENKLLTVSVTEQYPQAATDLRVYRGIFIDIPKGELPEDTEVRVEMTEMLVEDDLWTWNGG